eukprot:SAG22_NODE_16442_length_325_cov_0.787611_2_plen_59_part_01
MCLLPLLLPPRLPPHPDRPAARLSPGQDCYNIRLLDPAEFEMAEKLRGARKDFLESEQC